MHGESIGGMIGAHVANVGSTSNSTEEPAVVKCLLLDRTFASLDSLSARLLGWWAAAGIRYIYMWHTDVVTDYLGANCRYVSISFFVFCFDIYYF